MSEEEAPLGASTIQHFCERNDISESVYNSNRRKGLGPVELRIPGTSIVRITAKAERDWLRRWENPSPEDLALIEKTRSKLRKQAVDAVNKRHARPVKEQAA